MKLVAVGGPLNDQSIEVPDDMPRSVPWYALEKRHAVSPWLEKRHAVSPWLDMPLNWVSLDLDAPVKHAYYRTPVGLREYLIHNPKRCGCVL